MIISKLSNIRIEVYKESDTSKKLCQLNVYGEWYLFYFDVWKGKQSGSGMVVKVISDESETTSWTAVYDGLEFDGTESLLIEYSNGQLGDVIAWTPYVIEFLKNNLESYSNVTIKLKLYEFIANSFSLHFLLSEVDMLDNEVNSVSLLDGKIILEDINNKLVL